MSEGDTIHRIADVMRHTLRRDVITAAHGRPGGAQLERVVGSRTEKVAARGKHLLITFSNGLTLHTHLRMQGTWHRYRPGEPWRRSSEEAVATLWTDHAVAVCFSAHTVELLETRALPIHPVLSRLGPDLLGDDLDVDDAVRRLSRSSDTVAEALLDQRVVAGIGNVFRSEILAQLSTDPFLPARSLSGELARELLMTARGMLRANVGGGARVTVPDRPAGNRWVYRRRTCYRCGSTVRTTLLHGRTLYWCPSCQVGQGATSI